MAEASFLQSWYAEQCDGEWEQEFGIKVATLDNPGWLLQIDLLDTSLEGRVLHGANADSADERWIFAKSDGRVFQASGAYLSDVIRAFRVFVESRHASSESG